MMPADVIVYPGGGGRIIHRLRRPVSRPCHFCPEQHYFVCDYPIGDGKTCDKRLCLKHATRVKRGVDYCPDHAKLS